MDVLRILNYLIFIWRTFDELVQHIIGASLVIFFQDSSCEIFQRYVLDFCSSQGTFIGKSMILVVQPDKVVIVVLFVWSAAPLRVRGLCEIDIHVYSPENGFKMHWLSCGKPFCWICFVGCDDEGLKSS